MDYKKKYKNALPYIKDLIEHNVISTESAGKYFPELKENVDERMWNLLKKYVHYNISDLALDADHITREQLESWLEKQHIQKQETSYPKFDFDDILALQCCMETAEKVTEDKELYEKLKSLHSRLHDVYWLEKQGGQKQDPCNDCKDVMLNCHNFPCVKKKAFKQGKSVLELIKEESQVYKTGDDEIITYSETDGYKLYQPKFKVGDTMRTLQEASNGITSGLPVVVSIDNEYYHCNNELIAIKNQDDYEFPPMNKKPTAWSEEDEKKRNLLIDILNVNHPNEVFKVNPINTSNMEAMHTEELISWLKSLRPQNTWKPSDEQIKAVRLARSFVTDDFGENHTLSDVLVELEKQLKKLK